MAEDSPSLIIRGVWFFTVGWWATGIVLTIAWILNLTIIGLPLGIKMINYVPKVLTLKSPETDDVDSVEFGGSSDDSPSIIVRGAYFIFIGWWASGIFTVVAYLLCVSIIGLPFGVKMFNKLPKIVSLYDG